eukprot:3915842-Prymnesium_polylepis.3
MCGGSLFAHDVTQSTACSMFQAPSAVAAECARTGWTNPQPVVRDTVRTGQLTSSTHFLKFWRKSARPR